jgi:AraC-like DNA-binding protein
MAETTLHRPAKCVSPAEEEIQNAEGLLGLRITVHDLSGVFVDRQGRPLLDRWRGSHRRYLTCAIAYSRQCLDHCYREINKRCASTQEPFLHTCWKGLVEWAVPIRREGVHLATLFAGQWRRPGVSSDAALPGPCLDRIGQLPLPQEPHLARVGRLMATFAAGLLAKVDEIRGQAGAPRSRKEAIYRFLELHAPEPIGLDDLAEALHLSPGRTSHLVRELTGSSFQDLLVWERLRKAQALLRSTDLPVSQVGRLVGIDNECYFSRLFSARIGLPPSRYRRQGPATKDRPDIPPGADSDRG